MLQVTTVSTVYPGQKEFTDSKGDALPKKWQGFIDRAIKAGGIAIKDGMEIVGVQIPREITFPDLNNRTQFLKDCGDLWDNFGTYNRESSKSTDPRELSPKSNAFAVSIFRKAVINARDKYVSHLIKGKKRNKESLVLALAARSMFAECQQLGSGKISTEHAEELLAG